MTNMTRERERAPSGGGRAARGRAPSGGGRAARGRDKQSAGAGKTLRSDAWLTGDDKAAMQHRVALRTSGLTVGREGRPVSGIANSASDLNPCNLPLRALAGAVRRGMEDAGGTLAESQTAKVHVDLSALHFFDPDTGESLRDVP
jgi:hypothetical protein